MSLLGDIDRHHLTDPNTRDVYLYHYARFVLIQLADRRLFTDPSDYAAEALAFLDEAEAVPVDYFPEEA